MGTLPGLALEATGLARVLLIPSGLLLLFFGVFLLPLSVSIGLAVLAGRAVHAAVARAAVPAAGAGGAGSAALGAALLAGGAAFGAALTLCARARATGPLLGAVVALSLAFAGPAPPPLQTAAATAVLAAAFGAAYAAAPKEVAVFVSSYAGSYLVWHGLELIDGAVAPRVVAPAALVPDDADVWFSTLSFLVVGALGCAVQLILLGGQEGTVSEREHYVPIP